MTAGVRRRGLCAGLVVLLAAGLQGCGYRVADTFPAGYRTVSLPIFENQTFYKGVEYDLAEALTKQVVGRTPYRVAPADTADTVLEGRITGIRQQTTARTRDAGLPEQMQFQVTVDLAWKDLRTGETIMDRRGFSAVGRYIPARPIGETQSVARHDAVAQLAEAIVDQMRGAW